jgi:hypothetical protein
MLSSRIESSFTIKNNSPSSICFKIKTSSPKDFTVNPTSATIRPKDESSILVVFVGPPDSRNRGQKFLVQISFASDPNLVDWRSKEILEFKIGTKFMVAEVEEKSNNSFVEEMEDRVLSKSSTMFSDMEYEEEVNVNKKVEDEKKAVTVKNVELSKEIDKIKMEIEKAQYKLRHKKNLEIGTGEKFAKYSIPHVLFTFVIGLFIGFYVLG